MDTPATKDEGRNRLLAEVARAISLREGPEGVAQILHRIYSAGTISLKHLSRKSGIPLPVLAALARELERVNIAGQRAGEICLTREGVEFIEGQLNARTKPDVACPACRGEQVVIPPELRPALEKLEGYFNRRPPVDATLYQAPVLPESSIRRALYMYRAGALEAKSVILLGDDDFVSLAISLVGQALGRPDICERLTVVEADARIINFIGEVSAAESLKIERVRHDLRDPLPKELRQQFDVFETDPPHTVGGLNLFVSRALSALKPGPCRQGFLSFVAEAPDESIEIQRALAAMGLVIEQVNHSFNEYEGAQSSAGRGQLIHLLTSRATSPVISESTSSVAGTGEIRAARKEDLPAIVDFEIEIARISFPEDPITDPEVHRSKLSKILEREPEGMYVMALEGCVIGWLWITINTQPLTRRTYATMRSLAVRRDRRGSGAGRALLEFGIDYCRSRRAEWMVTKVFAENIPMRTLCLSLGFHIKHLSMEMRFDS